MLGIILIKESVGGRYVKKVKKLRNVAVEMDALKIGMGWHKNDLDKPQIFIQSTAGDSHPGSVHLDKVVKIAEKKAT